MTMGYIEMRDLLAELDITHEQMDEVWDGLLKTNWKVQNLSSNGMSWHDLPEHLIRDAVQRYKKQEVVQ